MAGMASPQHRLSIVNKQGSTSCPNSPGSSSKPDRSADYAAVRNLAESYGVDLLPLEMGFTPLRTQMKSEKPGARCSAADSCADLPDTPEVGETAPPTSVGRSLEAANPAGISVPAARRSPSPSKLAGLSAAAADPSKHSSPPKHAPAARAALAGYPIDVDGSEADVNSPSGYAEILEGEVDGDEEGDGLYFDEERLPIEERVALLEEERDMLVDKLLSTTAALHASEARNRQSEASQCQVSALLEQLQELLRRAEVERDRAKLQLKRHRASNSQFLFGAAAITAAALPPAEPFTIGTTSSTDGGEGSSGPRPRVKKYKTSRGGAPPGEEGPSSEGLGGPSSSSGGGAEEAVPPAYAHAPALPGQGSLELPSNRKQHSPIAASTGPPAAAGASVADSVKQVPQAGAPASTGAVDGWSSSGAARSGNVTAQGDDTNADTAKRVSASSVAGQGLPGSRRSSSCCSSNSDAASLSEPAATDPNVTLTPSTDEARPPVRSVISGFEALLHRQRTPRATLAPGSGGGRSRGRTSGSGSRSSSPMPSRGGSETAPGPAAAADTGAGAAAGPLEHGALEHADQAAAEDSGAAAEAAAGHSTAAEEPAADAVASAAAASAVAAPAASELQQGLSVEVKEHPESHEPHKKTYVDAAVAGAEAERTRRAQPRPRSLNGGRHGGAGSSSSAASTPTAAALCNAAPPGCGMGDSLHSEEYHEDHDGRLLLGPAAAAAPAAHCEPYDPRHFAPLRPVDRVFVSLTEGGVCDGQLGVKRGRSSSSPSASPRDWQGAAGSSLMTRSSPGSAFGSIISCDADSPGGASVTSGSASGATSCPGSLSPAAGGSSNGGSKPKGRSTSRLGMACPPTPAASDSGAATAAAAARGGAGEAKASSDGGKAQQAKGSKGQRTPRGSSTAGPAPTAGKASGKQRSPRACADSAAAPPAAAQQGAKQAARRTTSGQPAATVVSPPHTRAAAASSSSSSSAGTGPAGGGMRLLAAVAAVLLAVVVGLAMYVLQLQAQLSEKQAWCPAGSAPPPGAGSAP